jgi:hypothetical protein
MPPAAIAARARLSLLEVNLGDRGHKGGKRGSFLSILKHGLLILTRHTAALSKKKENKDHTSTYTDKIDPV